VGGICSIAAQHATLQVQDCQTLDDGHSADNPGWLVAEADARRQPDCRKTPVDYPGPPQFNASVTTPPLERGEGCMPAHLGENEVQDNQRGIGHDLWANNPPQANDTSRVFVPRLGTSLCVVR
jgi:hypothetical protein